MGKNKKGSLPSGYASHWQASLQAGLPKAGWLLVVETSAQSMLAIHSGKEETRHPISTSTPTFSRSVVNADPQFRAPFF